MQFAMTQLAFSAFGLGEVDAGCWMLDADPVRSCYNSCYNFGVLVWTVLEWVWEYGLAGPMVPGGAAKRSTVLVRDSDHGDESWRWWVCIKVLLYRMEEGKARMQW